MALVSLTAGHRDLDLEVLDQLGYRAGTLAHDVLDKAPSVRGAVALATCNRFEVYLDVPEPEPEPGAVDAVVRAVVGASAAGADQARAALRLRTGTEVPRHLFAVACGLDSMVVGEREIAGQVRRALVEAQADSTTTGELDRLFGAASRVSRAVENEAGLGAFGRSAVGVALDLAAQVAPAWDDVAVVLIGTGSYAGAAVSALGARGCRDVRVFSASGRAQEFARARGLVPVPPGALAEALGRADVVVSCSGSRKPILRTDDVSSAGLRRRAARESRPLVVIDLSLKGDVEPGVSDLPAVRLIDLASVRANAPAWGEAQLARANRLVAEAVAGFEGSVAERAADRAVVALRTHVREAVEAEIGRIPGSGLQPEQAARALRRLAAALLHSPSVRARDAARAGRSDEFLNALRLLHGVEP